MAVLSSPHETIRRPVNAHEWRGTIDRRSLDLDAARSPRRQHLATRGRAEVGVQRIRAMSSIRFAHGL